MRIRSITKSEKDIEQLTLLMNQWDDLPEELTTQYIRDKLQIIRKMDTSVVLVAENSEHDLVGYVFLTEVVFLGMEPFVELQSILVDKNCRNRGIGKALLAAAEQWTKRNGFDYVVLSSRVQLSGAHAFYKSQGYQAYKQSYFFRKELGTGSDVIE